MKNAQRHECATSQPPRTGPIAAVIPLKPDHVPMACPRRDGSNEAEMRARLPGTSSAAPTPCTARAAISHGTDCATPQAMDAAAKSATPSAYTRRRPKRSPSAPPTRSSEDRVSA